MDRFVSLTVIVICFISTCVFGQRQITGRLVDVETKKPVKDARVKIEGTEVETTSNFLGYFQLTIDTLDHLVIDHEGYELAKVVVPSVNNFQITLTKSSEEETSDEETIFLVVEESASPPGGVPAFYEQIAKKLKYPDQARKRHVEGKVFVEFVIERDGSITGVKAIQSIGSGCDEEAVRVLQSSPKWNPGTQRGKPVRQKMVLPIAFRIGGFPSTHYPVTYEAPSTDQDFYAFIGRNVKYPSQARRLGIEGVVIVEFAIDESGKIIQNALTKDIGAGCGEEVQRVLFNVPSELMVSLTKETKSQKFTFPVAFGLEHPFDVPELERNTEYFLLSEVYLTANLVQREVVSQRNNGGKIIIHSQNSRIEDLQKALEKPNSVKYLSLVNRAYTSFPKDILKLTNLEFLDLERNFLKDLPEEIERLTELEELYLVENEIQTLPDNFGMLKKIKILGLASNKLKFFPEEIASLERLEALDLGNNKISEIPSSIGQLKNLRFLVLQDNEIKKLPPEFYQLKKLEKIYLKGNPIPAAEIESLKQAFKKTEIVVN